MKRLQVPVPAGVAGEFSFSRVDFLCWLLFSICSISMLLQWQVKDPCHSAKSAGSRLHLTTYTPLTQRSWNGSTMLSWQSVGTYQGNELTWNSTVNTLPQSSQLAEPLWTDPGIKSGIGVRKLILLKEECMQGMSHQTFPQKSAQAWKKPPPPLPPNQVTENVNTNSPIMPTERSLGGHSTELKDRDWIMGAHKPSWLHYNCLCWQAFYKHKIGGKFFWEKMAIIKGWLWDWVSCNAGFNCTSIYLSKSRPGLSPAKKTNRCDLSVISSFTCWIILDSSMLQMVSTGVTKI